MAGPDRDAATPRRAPFLEQLTRQRRLWPFGSREALLLLTAPSMLTLGAWWGVALVSIVNRHTLRVVRAVELLRVETGTPRG